MSVRLVRRIGLLAVFACVAVVFAYVAVVFAHDQDDQGKLPPYKWVAIQNDADCYDTDSYDTKAFMCGARFKVYTTATDPEDVAYIAKEIYENRGLYGNLARYYFISSDRAIGCPSAEAFYSEDAPIPLRRVKQDWVAPHGKVVGGVYVVDRESKVPVWLRGPYNWVCARVSGYYIWWHTNFGS